MVVFKQRPKRGTGGYYTEICGKKHSRQKDYKCKGPEAGVCLA